MAQCNPWFNWKTVTGIKLWSILSVRYYERETQTCMFTLTDTIAPPSHFAIKFLICEISYYFQKKNQGFTAFLFSFLLFCCCCLFFVLCACVPWVLIFFPSASSDWSPGLVAGNQVSTKHPWCFWSTSAKLQIGNALLVAPLTKEILDVQFHSQAFLRHLRWDNSSGRACAWLLVWQTDIIKNSGGKKGDEREGICCFVPMLESLFGKKGVPGCTDMGIRTWCNEGMHTFSGYFG